MPAAARPNAAKAKRPTRRSQAERNAETQRRIKRAAVESISEIGLSRTTGAEIGRRAGVTWGAVQHHFGDKDGIVLAVLEESFERFAEALDGPVDDTASLEERVALFVERAWMHFKSPHYRTTSEILRSRPEDTAPAWHEDTVSVWNATWRRYFVESRLSPKRRIALMNYAISVLSGLSASGLVEARGAKRPTLELGFLQSTLVRELGESVPARPPAQPTRARVRKR